MTFSDMDFTRVLKIHKQNIRSKSSLILPLVKKMRKTKTIVPCLQGLE
jgi:hypothetical protein